MFYTFTRSCFTHLRDSVLQFTKLYFLVNERLTKRVIAIIIERSKSIESFFERHIEKHIERFIKIKIIVILRSVIFNKITCSIRIFMLNNLTRQFDEFCNYNFVALITLSIHYQFFF